MKIRNIDELIEVILSDQFNDEQIKKIIERALMVLFIKDLPPRKELAGMVTKFLKDYPNKEKPIFIDIDSDALDVEQ